ncbi:acyltransferase [Mucilaginibacter terrigena]|uniref:Acyltransferase n=1 Tax=Mucilaginibacter terrigena TaxID=2492395 RepID=A0A4Q5LPY1_9SPHI|nr:acyltransferase [Mucilaginibacter terrigena]RYU91486.1 acyltransferase [Mucilaginibacter terrigena]
MQAQYKQIESITILRAIAALLVCLVHIGILTGYHTTGLFQSIINIGPNGVAIFFVISGFILPYSLFKKEYILKDFFTFLLRRILRIDPPYWISIVIVFIAGLEPLSTINFRSIFYHLTYLVPFVTNAKWYLNVYWTLAIEFQFYIIIGLVYPVLMKIPAKSAVVAVIIPAVVCIALGANYSGIIVTNLYNFTMGFILFMWYVKKINTGFFIASLLLFAGYVMAAVSIKSGLFPLLTVAFVVLYKHKFSLKPLMFTGKISYSLYLLHMPVTYILVGWLRSRQIEPFYLFFASLITSIIVSAIFYALIERPAINYSKRL